MGMNSSSGSGSSSYQSTPLNLQNPAFTALSGPVAGGLSSLFGAGPNGFPTSGGTFSPFMVNGQPSNNVNTNPLVAPMTGNQTSLLQSIMGGSGANPRRFQ